MKEYVGVYNRLFSKFEIYRILAEDFNQARHIFVRVLRQEGYRFASMSNTRVKEHHTQSLDGVFTTISKKSFVD